MNAAASGQLPAGYARLGGSERKVRSSFRAVGPADPNEHVRVVIKLRPKSEIPDPEELGAVRPSERNSAMSITDLARQHGAEQADVDAVVAWAKKQQGVAVEEADATRRLVVLDGTVDSISATFATRLERYESPKGESYRGRVGHIHVPAALEPVITSITGLDNRRQARPHRPAATVQRGLHRFTPPELAKLYSFPEELDGTGQCIGILEFGGGYQEADLEAYFDRLKVQHPAVASVSVGGADNKPGSEDDYEVVLDIEVAGAAAPGASIAVYFSEFTEAGWVEALTAVIHDKENKPSVLSISWGFAEQEEIEGSFAFTTQVMDELNLLFKEAANLGITVVVAAGDDGSIDGIEDGKVHVDFPASSPYVLAVGGTTLVADHEARIDEVVWNNGIRADGPGHGATGGGISDYFEIPAWQANSPAQVPPSASTGFRGRGIPDVAAVADVRTGYAQYINGKMITDGGTSAAAPLWAALLARINQSLAQAGVDKRAGYINPFLYASVGDTAAFHEITEGNNDAHGNMNGAYTATAGWNPCAGWGTPDGTALLAAL